MSSGVYPLWSSLVLVLVLVSIPVTLWLARRLPWFSRHGSGSLRIVETLSVGPRERLIVVHTGDEFLLVGATGQNLTLIKSLDGFEPNQSEAESFSTVLGRMRGDRLPNSGPGQTR